MSAVPRIDHEQAAWMQSGRVSVTVASHDAAKRPTLGVSFGCRLSADATRLTVFLGARASADLLAALDAAGHAIVVWPEYDSTTKKSNTWSNHL